MNKNVLRKKRGRLQNISNFRIYHPRRKRGDGHRPFSITEGSAPVHIVRQKS